VSASAAIRVKAFIISPRHRVQIGFNAAIYRPDAADKDQRMRALGFRFVTVLLALVAFSGSAWADSAPALGDGPHLAIQLVAETNTPAAGSTITVALDTRPQPGWHGYWENPGDAGLPTKFDWTLPKGVTAGTPAYPMPTTLLIAGLMNYVYEKPYAPLVTLTIPAGIAKGTALPIKLHVDYLVCTAEICVPEKADLSLDLTVGDGAIDPVQRAQFDAWRQAQPRPLSSAATYQVANGTIRIAVPYPASAPLAQGYFFARTTGLVNYGAPQRVTRDGDSVVIETKATGAGGAPLAGILRIGDGQGLEISARPGVVAASAGTGGGGSAASVWSTAIVALLGAIVGGLILNIMPCVFPILSLKALSLAKANVDEGDARAEALAYTAGVIVVCVALGSIILALRAGGAATGWAFQLTDPRAVIVLLLLTVGISLNLAGLFELPTPRFAGRAGTSGAFATGALAAFVATPCTGPFMAAALGAALLLPWPAALAVFAGLGLGLSLPFLAIGFIPALRRLLPRPGGWMETFRRILSVPMWLTAIALAWLLGEQAGVNGMALGLIAALLGAIVLWIAGLRQRRGLAAGWVVGVALLVVAVGGAALIHRAPKASAATAASAAQPFSEAKLAELRAQNRPVFAYFTADWCLTCKVNEKGAIETDAVQNAFKQHNVAVLEGDWTDGDATLGRFIEAHNRAGVPLYLYYAPGAAEPQVLPQVLTKGMLEALAG
jgi:DsbC/DsbD-like thiol-disulfide interchange protein/cytochrome c biogenesis protein CcdA